MGRQINGPLYPAIDNIGIYCVFSGNKMKPTEQIHSEKQQMHDENLRIDADNSVIWNYSQKPPPKQQLHWRGVSHDAMHSKQ